MKYGFVFFGVVNIVYGLYGEISHVSHKSQIFKSLLL